MNIKIHIIKSSLPDILNKIYQHQYLIKIFQDKIFHHQYQITTFILSLKNLSHEKNVLQYIKIA